MEKLQAFWDRYRLHLIGGGVTLVAAASVGLQALESPPPTFADIAPSATPAPTLLAVDVQGAVANPGVWRVPNGSLVDDALFAAGGLTTAADAVRVARELNRSEPLKNHQKIYVPYIGEAVLEAAGRASTAAGSELVNLNTATLEELDSLPGVGPATAQKIIDYREQNGGFGSIEELLEVPGIGDAKFAEMKDRVTV